MPAFVKTKMITNEWVGDVEQAQQLSEFFRAIEQDGRIAPTHISIYMALLHYCAEHQFQNPIAVFSYEIMKIAKISTRSTYYKGVRDLNDFGYILFQSTRKRNQGSKIYLISKPSM